MLQSMSWVTAAMIALFSFGLWGIFAKLSIKYVDSTSAIIYQALGYLIIALITLALLNFKPNLNLKGIGLGVLTGFVSGFGCLFFLVAANKGKVSTVVTMTALYPIITIALAYFIFQEAVTARQGLGIIFALTAIYLFA